MCILLYLAQRFGVRSQQEQDSPHVVERCSWNPYLSRQEGEEFSESTNPTMDIPGHRQSGNRYTGKVTASWPSLMLWNSFMSSNDSNVLHNVWKREREPQSPSKDMCYKNSLVTQKRIKLTQLRLEQGLKSEFKKIQMQTVLSVRNYIVNYFWFIARAFQGGYGRARKQINKQANNNNNITK